MDMVLVDRELLKVAKQLTDHVFGPGGKPMGMKTILAIEALGDDLEKAIAQPATETSAERTLRQLGYTDNGGEYWKPPLGKPPRYITDPEIRFGGRCQMHPLSILPCEECAKMAQAY